jgi:hypothetical protein
MIARVGHPMPVNWKKRIVPKSPMEQPVRHQSVFTDARRQVAEHFQVNSDEISAVATNYP